MYSMRTVQMVVDAIISLHEVVRHAMHISYSHTSYPRTPDRLTHHQPHRGDRSHRLRLRPRALQRAPHRPSCPPHVRLSRACRSWSLQASSRRRKSVHLHAPAPPRSDDSVWVQTVLRLVCLQTCVVTVVLHIIWLATSLL